MAKLTPVEYFEKLKRRLSAATDDIRKGVEAVTENPMEKAAAKKDKWLQGIIDAHASGKWERGLLRTDLADWKKAMIDKGVARIATGIAGAEKKVVAFATELLPFQDRLKTEIDRMPDVTLDDSIARMAAWARGMAEFKRS